MDNLGRKQCLEINELLSLQRQRQKERLKLDPEASKQFETLAPDASSEGTVIEHALLEGTSSIIVIVNDVVLSKYSSNFFAHEKNTLHIREIPK